MQVGQTGSEAIGRVPYRDVPGAAEAYALAWTPFKERFLELLLIAIVWSVAASPAKIARIAGLNGLGALYYTLVVVPVTFGALNACLLAVRGTAPRVDHLLEPFGRAYPHVILAHLLWITLVGTGLVFLVIPGLVIATRLAFVGFLVMNERMDAIGALKESWRRTQGYGSTIFGVFLIGVPLMVAGFLAFGVGMLPAGILIHLALALVFDEVTETDRNPGTRSA